LIKYFCGQLCNRHFEKTAIWQLWIACVVRTITIKSKEIDETNTTTANTNGNTTRRLSASQAPRRIHGDDVKVVGRQFGPVEPRDVGRDRNAMRRYLGRLIVLSEKEGREVSSTYTLVYMARILLCCRQRTSPSGRPNKRCISSATNWCDYITSSEYTHTHTTAHVCLLVWHCGSVVATRQTASQTTAIVQTLHNTTINNNNNIIIATTTTYNKWQCRCRLARLRRTPPPRGSACTACTSNSRRRRPPLQPTQRHRTRSHTPSRSLTIEFNARSMKMQQTVFTLHHLLYHCHKSHNVETPLLPPL